MLSNDPTLTKEEKKKEDELPSERVLKKQLTGSAGINYRLSLKPGETDFFSQLQKIHDKEGLNIPPAKTDSIAVKSDKLSEVTSVSDSLPTAKP